MTDAAREIVEKSVEADARRMRWILSGHGYFMEEEMLCGHGPCNEDEQDAARARIDEAMSAHISDDPREPEATSAKYETAGTDLW